MSRFSTLAVMLVAIAAGPASGQDRGEPIRADSPRVCGDADGWEPLQRSLYSPRGMDWRDEHDIPAPSESDPAGPVKEADVCRALVGQVTERFRDPLDDPRTYGVHRFGDYYLLVAPAIKYNEGGEPTAMILHRLRVFVFRADSREFVAKSNLPEWPPR